MKREYIEPITGANLAQMGDDEIKDLVASWTKRLDMDLTDQDRYTAQSVLAYLAQEQGWRKRIRDVKCHWLKDTGFCRSEAVIARHGATHVCPKLNEAACTKDLLEASPPAPRSLASFLPRR
jgi:hypothetical protein